MEWRRFVTYLSNDPRSSHLTSHHRQNVHFRLSSILGQWECNLTISSRDCDRHVIKGEAAASPESTAEDTNQKTEKLTHNTQM